MTNTTTAPTAAQQFAADQLRDVVPAMLAAVKFGKRIGFAMLAAVLGSTYPHAALFLAGLPHVGWLGWVVPIVFGAGLLAMAHIAQTPGLHETARRRALVMVGATGAGEAAMQLAAPGYLGVKLMFAGVVLVGLGVKWTVSAIRPDLAAIEAAESTAAAQLVEIAPPATATAPATGRKCPTGCTCGKHTPRTAKAPVKATRKPRAVKANVPATADAVISAFEQHPDAPVSPAALGYVSAGGILIARNLAEALNG